MTEFQPKSLEGTEIIAPTHSPESPAPEQLTAEIENQQRLIFGTMAEIRRVVPNLSPEQYGDIQRSLYNLAEASLQSSRDIYGEPKAMAETEAEKAFKP